MYFRLCFIGSILDLFSCLPRECLFSQFLFSNCYVLDNNDSYSRLSNDVDQAVRLLFPIILVLVLLPTVINYFNNYACAHNFNIVAQISTNNTAIRLVRTYVGASWRFCKRPPTDVEITPQSQTYPSDSTRLPPRAVAATSMRVAAAAGVGAGEVELEDGSEPRRI
jgi:hypothetical protein